MKPAIKRLSEKLTTATDGGVACDAINSLTKYASKGDPDAKKTLAQYMMSGNVEHMRDFACSSLADIVNESDSELVPCFKTGLSDESIRYWSILGYSNTKGSDCYSELMELVQDETLPVEDRAHAVKCISSVSEQTFDRQLPADPGNWEEADIRVSEITSWAKSGFPNGTGYTLPIQHPSLNAPQTSFEKIVARLDKRLAKKRAKDQDLANPTNWLAVAEESDMNEITSRWKLPKVYLDFLTRFSPVGVNIDNKKFWNGGLRLFGAAELIEGQHGYSFNPVTNKAIRGWPKNHLVVASHGGDPFVIDLSQSDGDDAPVLTAEHGTGEWAFDEVNESLEMFLKSLLK